MKIKTILTLLSVFFLNTGCASTDNTDFQDERKKKILNPLKLNIFYDKTYPNPNFNKII